jgi:hypothetical protein
MTAHCAHCTLQAEAVQHSKKVPAADERAWLAAFAALPDARERLHCLASFWNLCSESERQAIFARFLQVREARHSPLWRVTYCILCAVQLSFLCAHIAVSAFVESSCDD